MEAGTFPQTLARPRTSVRTIIADYFELTKPKVQTLLLLTTITTMYVAGSPSLSLVALTCLGGALSAGGAGAINHWFDRDIDALMERTANRPVPSGRVAPGAALAYGIVLGVGIVLTCVNVVWSMKKGRKAGNDPWQANTLEWFVPSPPPVNNFDVVPRVRSVEPMKDIRRQVARTEAELEVGAESRH